MINQDYTWGISHLCNKVWGEVPLETLGAEIWANTRARVKHSSSVLYSRRKLIKYKFK